MKTIRGKLLAYFLVFVLLFQITAISIFISSNELTNKYDESFQRFLLLNSISQKSDELYAINKALMCLNRKKKISSYFEKKAELTAEKEKLARTLLHLIENIEIKNYINLVETFIHESELTVGFVLKEDIEQYTNHLEEARIAAGYIQESALELIDVELTAYQAYYKDLQERNGYFYYFHHLFIFNDNCFGNLFCYLVFNRNY